MDAELAFAWNRLRNRLRLPALAVALGALLLVAAGCDGGGGAGESAAGSSGGSSSGSAASGATEPAAGAPDTPVSSDDPSASTDDSSASGGAVGGSSGDAGTAVYVDSVEVRVLESFPVQVRASIAGNLADGCVRLGEATAERDGNTFRVALPASRSDGACTQALVPFTTTVSLPVRGVAKGTYTVEAGGQTATFTLSSDN